MNSRIFYSGMDRIYKKFECGIHIPENVFLNEIRYTNSDFIVSLSFENEINKKNYVEFTFENGPIAFRCMDEGVYPLSWSEKVPFWVSVVENSEYIEWFNEISSGVRAILDLKHYAIYTANECIDIIGGFPPSVEIFEWN